MSENSLEGVSPRNNFDDFYHSFLVVIQIMVSDNWDAIMITIARVKGNTAIVYFVSIIIIGVMFFLNIFLAILLENFGVDSEIMGGGNSGDKTTGGEDSNTFQQEDSGTGFIGKFQAIFKPRLSVKKKLAKNFSQDIQIDKGEQSASKEQLILDITDRKENIMSPEQKLALMKNAKSDLDLNNLNQNSLFEEE